MDKTCEKAFPLMNALYMHPVLTLKRNHKYTHFDGESGDRLMHHIQKCVQNALRILSFAQ